MLKLSKVGEEDAMLDRFVGIKVGMTQIFDENRSVVPVTVINVGNWFVTQIKTKELDGYVGLQLGLLKKKYCGQTFLTKWLKTKKDFFSYLREVLIDESDKENKFSVGQEVSLGDVAFKEKSFVNVIGTSRGLGFQGVMKRWGFSGGPSGHGSTLHRKPGSIGCMCTQGNVVKGKKLPGHCGSRRTTVKNLKVIRLDSEVGCLFVKGAVPGKKDSLLFIQKQK